jgi:hypothetical protein
MADQSNKTPEAPRSKRHPGRWLAATLLSVVVAGITAFAAGVGSNEANRVTSSPLPALSYSAAEAESECGPGTFVPAAGARRLLQEPRPSQWASVEHEPGAAHFAQDSVQVSIQGESDRTITLTGIKFKVRRARVPQGAVFQGGCAGPTEGRTIEVNLDPSPPRIVATSADPQGMLGAERNGRLVTRPIRFPWAVSLTEPLLLFVIATAKSCYCEWSAQMPWVSGARHGTIAIDHRGRSFVVVGGSGLEEHIFENGAWQTSVSE